MFRKPRLEEARQDEMKQDGTGWDQMVLIIEGKVHLILPKVLNDVGRTCFYSSYTNLHAFFKLRISSVLTFLSKGLLIIYDYLHTFEF